MKLKETTIEPKALWKHFAEICDIPHPSGHEERIIKYVLDFCEKLRIEAL